MSSKYKIAHVDIKSSSYIHIACHLQPCRAPEQQPEEEVPRLPLKGPDGTLTYERAAPRARIPATVRAPQLNCWIPVCPRQPPVAHTEQASHKIYNHTAVNICVAVDSRLRLAC